MGWKMTVSTFQLRQCGGARRHRMSPYVLKHFKHGKVGTSQSKAQSMNILLLRTRFEEVWGPLKEGVYHVILGKLKIMCESLIKAELVCSTSFAWFCLCFMHQVTQSIEAFIMVCCRGIVLNFSIIALVSDSVRIPSGMRLKGRASWIVYAVLGACVLYA